MFYLLNEKRDRNTKYYTSMTPSEENIEGYSYMPLKCEVTHVPNEEETFHFSLEKKKRNLYIIIFNETLSTAFLVIVILHRILSYRMTEIG